MYRIIAMAMCCCALKAYPQDGTVKNLQAESSRTIRKNDQDTTVKTWKKGGIYALNISQGSLSNWAAGGEEFSLAFNSLLSIYAFYKNGKNSWDNTFDFNLGYIKTTSLGGRKNDDRFDLLSKYGHALNPKLSVSGIFNVRSQFFRGYTFPDQVKTYSSNFFAPGYILLGLGLDYKPTSTLSIFFSPATARWLVVRDTALANKGLYGVHPGERHLLEFGAFLSANLLKEFSKSVSFKSRLDLFSNYNHHPENIDVYFTNLLNIKFAKVLSLAWGVDMIYDSDVKLFGTDHHSAALQLKSLVGLGLLVKFGD
jgi:hypothetical protein